MIRFPTLSVDERMKSILGPVRRSSKDESDPTGTFSLTEWGLHDNEADDAFEADAKVTDGPKTPHALGKGGISGHGNNASLAQRPLPHIPRLDFLTLTQSPSRTATQPTPVALCDITARHNQRAAPLIRALNASSITHAHPLENAQGIITFDDSEIPTVDRDKFDSVYSEIIDLLGKHTVTGSPRQTEVPTKKAVVWKPPTTEEPENHSPRNKHAGVVTQVNAKIDKYRNDPKERKALQGRIERYTLENRMQYINADKNYEESNKTEALMFTPREQEKVRRKKFDEERSHYTKVLSARVARDEEAAKEKRRRWEEKETYWELKQRARSVSAVSYYPFTPRAPSSVSATTMPDMSREFYGRKSKSPVGYSVPRPPQNVRRYAFRPKPPSEREKSTSKTPTETYEERVQPQYIEIDSDTLTEEG